MKELGEATGLSDVFMEGEDEGVEDGDDDGGDSIVPIDNSLAEGKEEGPLLGDDEGIDDGPVEILGDNEG